MKRRKREEKEGREGEKRIYDDRVLTTSLSKLHQTEKRREKRANRCREETERREERREGKNFMMIEY